MQAHIAIVKLPSVIPESSPLWGGPIILNPGGPGGSGVAFALQKGEAIQKVVGEKYSIIGFDPRGVNNTIPQISCFRNSVERRVWHAKGGGKVLNSTGALGNESLLVELGELYARSFIRARLCIEQNSKIVEYLGTPSTARDMHILSRAEWEGKIDIAGNPRSKGLQYWGFSYGSVLGITFAAMFPDEVERIVVDGVVKTRDYYRLGWSTNLYDADAVMDSFYEYCSLAGPLRCPFHTGTTPKDIQTRLESLLDFVKKNPVPAVLLDPYGVNNGEGLQPDLITYSDLKTIIFTALYQPLATFPALAEILVAVESRKPTALVDYKTMFDIKSFITCRAPVPPGAGLAPLTPPDNLHAHEATSAILCSDGTPLSPTLTAQDFLPYISFLRSQSRTSADPWAQIRLSCVGWKAQAREKPPKILTRDTPPHHGSKLRPRNPVLLVNTDRDPVTPVRNAFLMREWFEEGKAGLLVQEGVGHCSVRSPSLCAARVLREYFEEGKVPRGNWEPGSKGYGWCGIASRPFLGDVTQGYEIKDDLLQSVEMVGEAVADLGRVRATEWAY